MQLPMPISLTTPAFDDEECRLIEDAKRDKQAFATLYRRHHSIMASYIFRRVGDMHVLLLECVDLPERVRLGRSRKIVAFLP